MDHINRAGRRMLICMAGGLVLAILVWLLK